ncbi:hypothetical protein CU098_009107 [Rhizopus stolonifer]|uniref:Uncharacterized protein n=1 Tax=Rhizopus stolonifer TaxID=4846 RepID=A0A367KTH4_RHIST|nr:hypothetical protein CU098_009107 [Rhizopus stolonifer]
MKFSIAAASLCALTFLSSAVKADSYSDAIKEFCDGLDVTAPTASDVFVAGQNATVTVTRVANSHEKQITGLDLYSVDSSGNPKYVQNVWAVPSNSTAGLYYYRVWVTNIINGGHGPDCLKTSKTFKVTTGSHTNAAGFTYYEQSLDDSDYYHPEFAKGCFGLKVQNPAEGSTQTQGSHVAVMLSRDSASQTNTLKRLELIKSSNGQEESVETVWEGDELLTDAFTIKDHLNIPSDKFDSSASYYYKADVTSDSGETCSFQSGAFKVASA